VSWTNITMKVHVGPEIGIRSHIEINRLLQDISISLSHRTPRIWQRHLPLTLRQPLCQRSTRIRRVHGDNV
jgi:hypothetical protein